MEMSGCNSGVILANLIFGVLVLIQGVTTDSIKIPNEETALEFVVDHDETYKVLWNMFYKSAWEYSTNAMVDNEIRMVCNGLSFCSFVCLGFIVPLENFSLIWRRHPTGEGLQILTFAWHSWPLSSEGSLACHTYCDTGHPFLMVISKHP